jgi:hypothetical protein
LPDGNIRCFSLRFDADRREDSQSIFLAFDLSLEDDAFSWSDCGLNWQNTPALFLALVNLQIS